MFLSKKSKLVFPVKVNSEKSKFLVKNNKVSVHDLDIIVGMLIY